MLHSMKALKRCAIHASDGELGKVSDAFFDDEYWVVRHLVVATGSWLTRREVLLSPQSIGSADWQGERVHLDLERSHIESSPGISSHQPVSRQAEASLARHYGLPYYWSGGGKQVYSDQQVRTIQRDLDAGKPEDRHLQSCNEVAGYTISASDGQVGQVNDFLFDVEDWSLQYLVVESRDLWPDKQVLLPVDAIEDVDWVGHQVRVALHSDEVKNGLTYDPGNLPPARRHTPHAGTPPGAGTRGSRPGL